MPKPILGAHTHIKTDDKNCNSALTPCVKHMLCVSCFTHTYTHTSWGGQAGRFEIDNISLWKGKFICSWHPIWPIELCCWLRRRMKKKTLPAFERAKKFKCLKTLKNTFNLEKNVACFWAVQKIQVFATPKRKTAKYALSRSLCVWVCICVSGKPKGPLGTGHCAGRKLDGMGEEYKEGITK